MIEIEALHEQESGDDLIAGAFDLLLVGASWDIRCLTVIDSQDLSINDAIVLSYSDAGLSGRAERHRDALLSFLRGRSQEVHSVQVVSADMVETWSLIRTKMLDVYRRTGRALRVAVDLTSVPRYVSLGVLAFGARSGVVMHSTYWYSAAGSYEDVERPGGPPGSSQFTTGTWLPQPVPGLSRPTAGGKPVHLYVSAGFEGLLTNRLVQDLEPSKVSIYYSKSVIAELTDEARNQNRQLETDFLVDESSIRTYGLFDVDGVLSDILLRRSTIQDSIHGPNRPIETSFLICGSKPHALAFAIAACQDDIKNVYFGLPIERREVTAGRVGPYFRCDTRSLWM